MINKPLRGNFSNFVIKFFIVTYIIDTCIEFVDGELQKLENIKHEHNCNGVEKLFKLYTTNTNTNMYLFDAKDRLKKYETVNEIIDDDVGLDDVEAVSSL